MSMEPHHQMSIDGIHRKITSIKAELESFRQHQTLGPWMHSLKAMLQQWKDHLGMMGDQAETEIWKRTTSWLRSKT